MTRLFVFGTGHALVTKLYNTCYALEDGKEFFQLDGGGGNGLLAAWDAMSVAREQVRHLFISHLHTDHLLGCIWATRTIAHAMSGGTYEGDFSVYATPDLLGRFRQICELTLRRDECALFDSRIRLIPIHHGMKAQVGSYAVTFFDTGSGKVEQFGCRVETAQGLSLAYHGDEPYHSGSKPYVEYCDWVLFDALCLYEERNLHHPYETSHSTVKDACQAAQGLHVGNLVLAHTEDTHGPLRKELYLREGRQYFHGNLYVPDDREIIALG